MLQISEDPPAEPPPPIAEGKLIPGIPALQVDASSFITHKRKLMGNIVRGEIDGHTTLELVVHAAPRGVPAVRTPEAEWRALVFALRVARQQHHYRGPLQILTDAQSNIHCWSDDMGAGKGWEQPLPYWCKEVHILWVPRKRLTETDHALSFWMGIVREALFGGRLPELAHAFGLTKIAKEEGFKVGLSLKGSEARMWVEKEPTPVQPL
jgi:hypothetical protein